MSELFVRPGKLPTPPEHVAILATNAGLQLPDAYLAELIDAYGYIERMLARIHRGRDRADEPAHVFVASAFQALGEPRA